MKFNLLIVLISLKLSFGLSENSNNKEFNSFENLIRDLIRRGENKLLPILLQLESKNRISSQCSSSIRQTLKNALDMKEWAIQMIDSSGRLPIGILDGTLVSAGDYDQCLHVKTQTDIEIPFVGQYCTVKLTLPLDLDIHYPNDTYYERALFAFKNQLTPAIYNAFCVPSTCTAKHVKIILTEIFNPYNIEVDLPINACEHSKEVMTLSLSQKLMLGYLSAIVLMFILAAYIDHYYHNHKNFENWGKLTIFAKSFSPVRNIRRFFNPRENDNELNLDIIHFLRITFLLLTICVHVFLNGGIVMPTTVYGLRRMLEMSRQLFSQIAANGAVVMELLYFLSGTLVVVSGLKFFQNRNNLSFKLFLFNRWIRLTPITLVAISVTVLLPLIGSGPSFKLFYKQEIENCDTKLWLNLLFINNFDTSYKMCSLTTWFLSVDMQLYLLSYIALILLASKPKYGLLYAIIFVILGMLIPAALTYFWDIPIEAILTDKCNVGQDDTSHISHYPTYQHLTTYFMGVITGYLVVTIDRINLSHVTQNIISISLLGLSLATTLSTYLFNGLRWEITKPMLTFYSGFMKLSFILGFCWIIIVTVRGNGGPAGIFTALSRISNKQLSKLCFAASITNMDLIRFNIFHSRQPIDYANPMSLLITVFGFTTFSLILGFIIHITVEMPFHIFFKLLMKSTVKEELKDNIQRKKGS